MTGPAPPHWVARTAAEFPPRLGALPDPLEGIWLRSAIEPGALGAELWSRPAAALVGSRAASAAGRQLSRDLAYGLARAGVVIVSGLARGIDAAAHEGALLAGGATVGVLGCGLDACYPPEHEELAERMTAKGALVSEWPAGTAARAWHFPRRNRLISGLADVVVLVEAEERSGTHHTIQFAIAQGRDVLAVPRDPLLPGSIGPNRLLRDGAAPVLGPQDVLAALRGWSGRGSPAVPAPPSTGSGAAEQEDGLASGICRRLSQGGALAPSELAESLPEAEAAAIVAALMGLEVQGAVRRAPGGRYRLAES